MFKSTRYISIEVSTWVKKLCLHVDHHFDLLLPPVFIPGNKLFNQSYALFSSYVNLYYSLTVDLCTKTS